jgi:glycosyltransferase 2 family protein
VNRRILFLAAGVAISGISVWWLLRRVDHAGIVEQVRRVSWGVWLAAAVTYLLGFLPRALRWHLMLKPVSLVCLRKLAHAIVLGYAGNNVLPFRLGEVIRAVAFERLSGVSAATGLASVVIERLLDGITIVLVLLVTVALAHRDLLGSASMRPIFLGAVALTFIGLVGLVCAIWFGDRFVRFAGRRWPRVQELLARVNAGFRFLRDPRILAGVLVTSLLVWSIEGAMFVIFAAALHLPSPLLAGYLALSVVNLGILIPSAPGYIGVFQVASVIALGVLGNDAAAGLAFGILVHSAQFLPLTLLGLIAAVPLWSDLRQVTSR